MFSYYAKHLGAIDNWSIQHCISFFIFSWKIKKVDISCESSAGQMIDMNWIIQSYFLGKYHKIDSFFAEFAGRVKKINPESAK